MTFSSIPSWSDSFQYKPSPGVLSSGSSGGGMAFPVAGALSLGSSLLSGIFGMGQARTAASIAQAQLKAQNQAFLEARELNKGQLGASMWGPIFQAGVGGDVAFAREKRARELELGPFAEKELGLNTESARRERLARISPEAKEAARFENKLAIDRALAERRAVTDAMFGPIASSYRGFA